MVFERVMTRYFKRDEAGQSMVEYGLIIALIAVAAIAGLSLMADGVGSLWGWIGSEVTNAVESVMD